ncbi:MAG TPA: N-acetylglucosamine-6-phosphate deacetylase [Acidimicrobiales bacterium]|nr:N-acetylglucosamine-6-phosphate deacetylase [Acidimicrobiales bacterium]
MAAITAARVVTPSGTLAPGVVDVDDTTGLIAEVRSASGPARDVVLAPGFVDLQVNGIGDIDVAHASGDDWDRLDALLAAQGTTAWCPTLVTAPLASYADRLAAIAGARDRSGARPAMIGAHLEGPFLGGAPGAHRLDLIVDPDLGWIAALPDVVVLTTLAPEAHRATDAITAFTRRHVVVSLGHSTATFAESIDAVDSGARLVTHLFNGMGALHHREPGLLGAALTDDRLTVSLIADLVHVHPAAIHLAFSSKGAGRVVLVTDAVAWERGAVGGTPLHVADGAPRLADGTLAGSMLTMDRAVANVVDRCDVALDDAVRAASTTPAALMGLADRGAIDVGRRADLVALDPDLACVATWIGGEAVHG